MAVPAHKNNNALNRAWITKWKNANLYSPSAIANIIIPNWLSVDKAIIFLRSYSKFATSPDINIVNVETNNKKDLELKSNVFENRIRRYTPAVTRVDEWTRADTGVGAAIAAGSQAEKGIWALFVIAAKVIKYPIKLDCKGSDQNLHTVKL